MTATVAKRARPGSPEVGALLGVRHPNVASLHLVRDDGEGSIVELVRAPGGSLHELLGARRLEPPEAATVAAAVADALAALHGRGLVHGDVHPGNILFDATMTPLLADLDAVVPAGVGTGAGAAGFTAPEVEAGRAPTPASDQWALAACIRASLGPVLPTPLAVALTVASSTNPDDRFASVRAFADAVGHAVAPGPIAPTERLAPRPPPITRRLGANPAARAPGPTRPRRRARLVLAAVAVVLAGVGILARAQGGAGGGALPPCDGATPRVAPGDRAVLADPAGAGCSVLVVQHGDELVVPLGGQLRRFRVGRAGDVALLGRWDCGTADLLAVYRPSDGRLLEYGAWGAGDPVATAQLRPGATPVVRRQERCDEVTADG